MLAIRLQRHGRKGYAHYRFIVQDSRRSPYSGRVVAQIGHYNPHSKDVKLDKEKVKFYLDNGAHPSQTVAKILKSEKVRLPGWVEKPSNKKRSTKSPEKLRKNQAQSSEPAEEKAKAEATSTNDEAKSDQAQSSTSGEADSAVDAGKEETSADKTDEKPAEKLEDTETKSTEETPAEDKPAKQEKEEPEAKDTQDQGEEKSKEG
jgi:small subunit ribosomal protein S16